MLHATILTWTQRRLKSPCKKVSGMQKLWCNILVWKNTYWFPRSNILLHKSENFITLIQRQAIQNISQKHKRCRCSADTCEQQGIFCSPNLNRNAIKCTAFGRRYVQKEEKFLRCLTKSLGSSRSLHESHFSMYTYADKSFALMHSK